MKAQRRHELKQNSLIATLRQLPTTIKQYQSQIALVVVVIALAVVLIRYKINSAAERLAEAQASLGIAGDDLSRLRQTQPNPRDDSKAIMQEREMLFSEGVKEADDALEKAPLSKESLRAQALLTKGDLNFEVANAPEFPGAATEPSLRPSESDQQLLDDAYEAYSQVVQNYPNQTSDVTQAHFGLGAVAEDRAVLNGGSDPAQWAAAKQQFQAVLDSDAPAGFKNLASQQMQLLPQLQRPLMTELSALTSPASTQPTKK
jgi:hypothetical protein